MKYIVNDRVTHLASPGSEGIVTDVMDYGNGVVTRYQVDWGDGHGPKWYNYDQLDLVAKSVTIKASDLTGGSSNYYKLHIEHPMGDKEPFDVECNEIIEALNMNFAEGNAFKALWRRAAARLGNGKPGTSSLYDAEKVEFFGARLVEQSKNGG